MKIEIQVPSFGESVVEVTIGEVLKASGSFVRLDEEILEFETDKLNQVLHAPANGKLSLFVQTKDVVKVGQVIGTIESVSTTQPPSPLQEEKAPPPQKPLEQKAPPPPQKPPRQETKNAPVKEAPREARGETRKKMSKLRRVISERLVQVKNETAMLTTFNEVDMTSVMAVRAREQESFQKKYGVKLGFMSFFIKVAASALKKFPEVNARIDQDEIVYPNYYDIGVAVGTDKGLMVPVLRNVDQLSYAEIEERLKMFAEKARSQTISVDDLQGGTFSITNGGTYGSLFSTPILNPPQSAILGMHNIVKRAVVVEDKIEIRPMMYLALSYDHRIIDGKEAISFLIHIKENLEEPARLLLDL